MSSEQGIVATQRNRIFGLLHKLGKTGVRHDYVIDITNGREASTSALTFDEANAMIAILEAEYRTMGNADTMRKKIISCCRECGMNIGARADMKAIYAWVLKYGYLHKPLNTYTAAELRKLVTQAENLRQSFLKGINK